MKYKLKVLFFILFSVVLLDQWTKRLAIDYLKKPEQSDFTQKCDLLDSSCKKRCLALTSSTGRSLINCEKNCKTTTEKCLQKAEKHYQRALERWNYRQMEMASSLLCREVEFSGSSRPECVVIKGLFHLTYRTNYGAAWGIFSDVHHSIRRPFFTSITIFAILFILYLFFFKIDKRHKLMIFALSFILGGAIGNFIDRMTLGFVVDFLEFFYKNRQYSWPTFNIADVAISIGVVLISVELLLFSKDPLEDTSKPSPYVYYPYLIPYIPDAPADHSPKVEFKVTDLPSRQKAQLSPSSERDSERGGKSQEKSESVLQEKESKGLGETDGDKSKSGEDEKAISSEESGGDKSKSGEGEKA